MIRWIRRRLFPQALDRRLAAELRFHLDQQAADFMAQGMDQEEAYRRAAIAMGGLEQVRQRCRDRRWENCCAGLFGDFRLALRRLLKEPRFSLMAVTVLGLGIGSTTLVFSLANGLLLRPLSYPHLDRIVAIDEYSPTDANEKGTVNFLNYLDLRARTRLLSDIGIYDDGNIDILFRDSAMSVPGARATDGLFSVLGVAPLLGRTLNRDDCLPHAPLVAVISQEFWQQHYGGDSSVLGQYVETEDHRFRIVGVMPRGFHFPGRAELWVPLQTDPAHANRTDYNRQAIARLKSGVSLEAANTELESLLQEIHRENPVSNNNWHIHAVFLRRALTAEYSKPVISLLVAVAFLLLIACANVSYLLLVRASARASEMAVREAIGASRLRIMRQLTAENLVLGAAGCSLGVILAYLGTPALLSLIPVDLPSWMNFSVDIRVLIFALGIAVLTAIGAGLAPMILSTSGNLTLSLRGGGRVQSSSGNQKTLRRVLIVAELALSMVLLVGAGVMVQSFRALISQNLGYAPQNLLSLGINYPDRSYPDGPKARALINELIEKMAVQPGVISVAAMTEPPLESTWTRIFTIEGHLLPLKDMQFVTHIVVTPGYFRTLQLPLLQGRDFNEADYDTPNVLIVSKSFAAARWAHESAIGKRVRFGPPKNQEPWHTVIGVVADSKMRGLQKAETAAVYLPYSPEVTPAIFLVRASADPLKLVPALRALIGGVDRSISVSAVLTLDQIREQGSWRERFFSVLMTSFTGIALMLAAVGFYAMLSYNVSLQRQEIAIRIALGASYSRVLQLVMSEGLRLVGIGLAVGAVLAAGLTRLLQSQIFQVSPMDPVAWIAAVLALIVVAALAMFSPVRKAIRVDPVVALREQ
jgi:putative ABC transport system permease protein